MADDDSFEHSGSGFDLSGQMLENRYHVSELLGRGGFGTVWLAIDERSFGRRVVVKVPHPEFLADPGFRKRFEKEIQSLVHLEHPRIVKVLDMGTLGNVPYAVLQFLPGGSLADRIDSSGGILGVAEVKKWLASVAEALDFIHRKGFLHRDVKPANILFDAEGHVYLSDFGIAKALEPQGTQLTQAGRVPGSPQYMAPEAMKRAPLGAAYDQYALGVVVYQALCGQPPHEGDTPLAILVQRATQPARPLGDRAPGLPPGAVAAVMRTLEADPAARFSTCTAFAEAFEHGLRWQIEALETPTAELDTSREVLALAPPTPGAPAGRSPTAAATDSAPPTPRTTTPAVARPRRGWLAVLAVAVLAVGLGLGGAYLGGLLGPRRPPVEVGRGRLVVSSVPPRAHITAIDQDGRRTEGLTPASLSVEVGDYTVEVTRTGYETFRQRVRVLAAEEVHVDASLLASVIATPVEEPAVPRVMESPSPTAPPPSPTAPPPSPTAPPPSPTAPPPSPTAPPPSPTVPAATPVPTGKPGQIETITLPGLEDLDLVWVQGGTFWMGCTPQGTCDDSETPRHQVHVDGFWIGRYEVTQRQWKSVMNTNPSVFKGDPRPVETVSWDEVQEFLAHAGLSLRLPTEAEWEYAARGGVDDQLYTWGDAAPDGSQANFCDQSCKVSGNDATSNDGYAATAPGGNFPPNGFGLYDMIGNVSEWCRDGFRAQAYKRRQGVTSNPFVAEGIESSSETGSGMLRVIRGGNWGSRAFELQTGHRASALSSSRLNTTGFRVARSAGP
jgi:serine/threonine-protein kinase PpkA